MTSGALTEYDDSSRSVEAYMTFSLVPECSRCRSGGCSRRFLGMLLRDVGLTWFLSLPMWGSMCTG
jgi:hypothetical protein